MEKFEQQMVYMVLCKYALIENDQSISEIES